MRLLAGWIAGKLMTPPADDHQHHQWPVADGHLIAEQRDEKFNKHKLLQENRTHKYSRRLLEVGKFSASEIINRCDANINLHF